MDKPIDIDKIDLHSMPLRGLKILRKILKKYRNNDEAKKKLDEINKLIVLKKNG